MSDYSALVIADGGANLLGYWPSDAEYLLADRSGAGNSGTAAGGVTIGSVAALGELTASDFDGVNGRVATGLSPFPTGVVRTFEGWANRDAAGATQHTLLGGSTPSSPTLRVNSTAAPADIIFRADRSSSTGQVTWTGAWPSDAAWHHWMFVFDDPGNTAKLYIDGALISSQATTGVFNITPGNYQIATNSTSTDPFDGKQAHVAVYNGDRSALAASHNTAGRSVRRRPRQIVRPTPAVMRAAVR